MTTTDTAWERLVSAALLGTDRRPPAGARGPEAAGALLDAAARHTLRRRAGLRPGPAAAPLEPAPHDPRPAGAPQEIPATSFVHGVRAMKLRGGRLVERG
ncbi:DUF5691 domain-containing protein, partial [Streptomyces roseolus]